jgi:hypothetical protein
LKVEGNVTVSSLEKIEMKTNKYTSNFFSDERMRGEYQEQAPTIVAHISSPFSGQYPPRLQASHHQ